jgi:tetratricopeptide (TPR) repeat protein
MIKLLMKSGEETRELEFNGGPITIGRSEENSLRLPDKKSSRKHARIEKVGEEYLLTDLESGNGTKVNGQDVAGTRALAKGDEIKIGFSSLYVLNLDTPAAAVPAAPPLPVATVVAPPPAPAPAPAAAATPDAAEKKGPHTRRSHYHRSSSSGGKLVAAAALLIIGGAIGFVGWQYASRMPSAKPPVAANRPIEKRVGPTVQEASEAYRAFQARTQAAEVDDVLVKEASGLADRYGEVYPDFEKLVSELNQKRSEQISKMSFDQVNGLVQAAMAEKRYGAAIDACKALKGSKDAAQAGALLEKILEQVRAEFKSVDDFGKKLAEQKQYSAAAEHYRKEASRFRGTEHYRYLANKPENLEMLAAVELAATRAQQAKAEASTEIAKAPEPPKPAPEPPKPAMEPPKPKMDAPKPAMEPPKPKPEPPKPAPPPPPPPPPAPKPEPAKPAADAPKEDAPKSAIKKPAVLCDCKKIGKGNYCVKCDRELGPDDLRKNVCKRCEEKPKKVDVCIKRYFQAECHPEKVDDKPVFC